MIGHYEIGGSEPFGAARLRSQTTSDVVRVHAPTYRPPYPDLLEGVDHDPGPAKFGVYQRHLDNDDIVESLQIGLDPTEDERMGDRLQRGQLVWLGKDNPCEPRPIDDTTHHHVGPTLGNRRESLVLQHCVTNRVGVDSAYVVLCQQTPHFALARPDAAGQEPATVQGTHIGRR